MKTYHYGVRAKSPHLLTRVTGLVVMEIYATNPNGDPNADGVPRIMPDLRGLISNGSFKRKYRDLIADGHPAATAFLEDMGLKVGDNLIAMKKMEETNDQVGKQAAMLNQARKDGHFSHHDVRLFGGFFAPAKQVKTVTLMPKSPRPKSLLRILSTRRGLWSLEMASPSLQSKS